MKIAILRASYAQSNADTKEFDLPYDPRPWLEDHDCTVFDIHKGAEKLVIERLSGFDAIINLCDGALDEDRAGVELIHLMESAKLPFTGANSKGYEPTRAEMKTACEKCGISYPRGIELTALKEDLGLNFPLIVKHPNSYNSVGMTKASKVQSQAELAAQVNRMATKYGSALVEEFVSGEEYTVLVCEDPSNNRGAHAFLPIQYQFPAGEDFKHFNMKWVNFADMQSYPVRDKALAEQLKELSLALFLEMNIGGYARCDIRSNAEGELFLLEINPNCSVFYPPEDAGSADLILLAEENGHELFLDCIIRAAKKRSLSV